MSTAGTRPSFSVQPPISSLILGRHRKRKHKHIILIPSLPLCEAPLCKTEKTILSSVACREVIIPMTVTLCQIWSQHGSVTSPHPSLHLCELHSTQKDALLISLLEAKLWSSIYPASVLWERPRLPYALVVQLYQLPRLCSANWTRFTL